MTDTIVYRQPDARPRVNARLSQEQYDAVLRACKRQNIGVGDFVRRAVQQAVRRGLKSEKPDAPLQAAGLV